MAYEPPEIEENRYEVPRSWLAGQEGGRFGPRVRRAVAALLGGLLLIRGLRRRSLRGAIMAVAGGWLLNRTFGLDERVREAAGSESPIEGWREGLSEAAGPTEVSRTATVGKPADELYEIWRDPDQLSQIVGHFAEVTAPAEDRLRWRARGPMDREVGWETHVVEAEPGELIRWETPPDAMLPNEGSVRFEPASGDRGTKVTLSMRFDPPGGTLGDVALRQLDFVPDTIAGEALRRFKSLAETGEIQTTEGNVSGRGRGDLV